MTRHHERHAPQGFRHRRIALGCNPHPRPRRPMASSSTPSRPPAYTATRPAPPAPRGPRMSASTLTRPVPNAPASALANAASRTSRPAAEREAALVARACRAIEAAEDTPSLEALAAAAGLSPFHFHRLFRRIVGVTPKAYASEQRARRVQASLQRGESVTGAIYDAGFNSSGRFYEAADGMLGMRPSAYRAGGQRRADPARHRPQLARRRPGRGDRRAACAPSCSATTPDALLADLRTRFPARPAQPAEPGFGAWVAQVVAHVDAPQRRARRCRSTSRAPPSSAGSGRCCRRSRRAPPSPTARSPPVSARPRRCAPWPGRAPPTSWPSPSRATASSAPTARSPAIAGASSRKRALLEREATTTR